MKVEELKNIAFGLHCLQMYEMNVQIELYLATEEFIKVRKLSQFMNIINFLG